MIAVIQRVREARVEIEGQVVGAIGTGMVALIAIQPDDGEPQVQRMLQRLLGYRLFADAAGRMNRSLHETAGDLLLISQFTLAADTRKGMRPGFSTAATPDQAEPLFARLLELARQAHPKVATGRFGADMLVSLVNDGPVTFHLQVH